MKAKVFTGDKEKFYEKRIQELEKREQLEEQRKKKENLDLQAKLKQNQKNAFETQHEQQPANETNQKSSEICQNFSMSPKNVGERITAGS